MQDLPALELYGFLTVGEALGEGMEGLFPPVFSSVWNPACQELGTHPLCAGTWAKKVSDLPYWHSPCGSKSEFSVLSVMALTFPLIPQVGAFLCLSHCSRVNLRWVTSWEGGEVEALENQLAGRKVQ